MKTQKQIKQWIKELKDEKKSWHRDEIDKENIQDEINILTEVLK